MFSWFFSFFGFLCLLIFHRNIFQFIFSLSLEGSFLIPQFFLSLTVNFKLPHVTLFLQFLSGAGFACEKRMLLDLLEVHSLGRIRIEHGFNKMFKIV